MFHSSSAYGTDDVQTSGGYFHMANVFYRQNKLDVAFSLYNQVLYIQYWYTLNYNFLYHAFKLAILPLHIGDERFENVHKTNNLILKISFCRQNKFLKSNNTA